MLGFIPCLYLPLSYLCLSFQEFSINFLKKPAEKIIMKRKTIFNQPVTYFWIASNFLFLFLDRKTFFINNDIDGTVVIIGNFILFLVSLFALIITQRSFRSENPQAFVRAVYSGFIIKFFVVAIAAFAYIMVAKKSVSKPALIICAGLYIIYTVLEIRKLFSMLKPKKHA